MKLLLDECTPKRLKNNFRGHEIQTVDEAGLKGVLNGDLLRAAIRQQFDVLITVDRRLLFQQNLSQFNIAVVILVAKPCRYVQLRTLVPEALVALKRIKAGEVVIIQ
jgi:predicted nuclease of predicted toxin-antitoxin system